MGNWLLDPENLTIAAGGAGTIGGSGDQVVNATSFQNSAATVTLTATNDITFNQAITMPNPSAGLTARAGRNLVVNDGMTIATNNGAINFTADSDRNGSGELILSQGSGLSTNGAAMNLIVDHGAAAVPVVGKGRAVGIWRLRHAGIRVGCWQDFQTAVAWEKCPAQ